MDDVSRPLSIPTGRVAQRLKALQEPSPRPISRSENMAKQASSSMSGSSFASQEKRPGTSTPILQGTQAGTIVRDDLASPDAVKPSTTKDSSEHEETEERGRSLQKHAEVESEETEKIEDLLHDVRSRLYSVQKIVARERSGSSEARDEMLDELGSMLDTAIATTMTPLNTPNVQPHNSYLEDASTSVPLTKQSRPSSQLSRSRSLKNAKPTHIRLSSRPRLTGDFAQRAAMTESPTRVTSPGPATISPHSHFDNQLANQMGTNRPRRTSESATTFPPPPGFPLSSPVRERTLLWESMSRAAISEENVTKCPHFVTRFHAVSPTARGPERSNTSTPPIPLALPQFVEAERRTEEGANSKPISMSNREDDNAQLSPPKSSRTISSQWPERLHLVTSGATTVQQSPSIATPAEHDEHHQKQRKSVVTSKIRELLTSTGRKVSSNTQAEPTLRSDPASIRLYEMRESVDDLDSMDQQHLPELQATPDEMKMLYSTDGGHSLSQTSGGLADDGVTGTSSSKVVSRKPTFDRKLVSSPNKRAGSPAKVNVASTPSRGRTGRNSSPGGRPYSVDHRFALSPSRSHSRGSRGSLTFNIKARVSPGRGLRKKDDTELFVTANIESDDSDEDGSRVHADHSRSG